MQFCTQIGVSSFVVWISVGGLPLAMAAVFSSLQTYATQIPHILNTYFADTLEPQHQARQSLSMPSSGQIYVVLEIAGPAVAVRALEETPHR